jgi:16S rRNA (guanine527-N7)-methyltransferase
MIGAKDEPSQGSPSPDDSSLEVAQRLNTALQSAGMTRLEPALAVRFAAYLSLLLRWNQRVNLTAIRDEAGIISRHFVESIACTRALPSGIDTLLDLGSGGGFPGIPIALCRPEISVTLAESAGKKAAFLQEAARLLGISATVHGRRAEELRTVFDCITLRAVDRMPHAVKLAAGLVREGGWLALMTTDREAADLQTVAGPSFEWTSHIHLPGSSERLIALGQNTGSALGSGPQIPA